MDLPVGDDGFVPCPAARGRGRWLPALAVIYVLIVAAMLLYFVGSGSVRNLRYEIGDLRRDVGEVQREIEFRSKQDDRDIGIVPCVVELREWQLPLSSTRSSMLRHVSNQAVGRVQCIQGADHVP